MIDDTRVSAELEAQLMEALVKILVRHPDPLSVIESSVRAAHDSVPESYYAPKTLLH